MMNSTKQVSDDLTQVLSKDASMANPDEIASELLDRDCQVFSLIGLSGGGSSAVFYDWPIWAVRTIPVKDDGLGGLTSSQSVASHHYGRVETYIETCGKAHWDWLHPRYRWVFSNDSMNGLQW